METGEHSKETKEEEMTEETGEHTKEKKEKELLPDMEMKIHKTPDGEIVFEFNLQGYSEEDMNATEEVQEMCNQVKVLTEKQFDTSYKKFEAKRYKVRETEKGMDYIIEVDVGPVAFNWVHLFVTKFLDSTVKLTDLKVAMRDNAPIRPMVTPQGDSLFFTE
ncbi:uncharacterized protein [Montipora capricornis]|uniref:uncharacterized protein n=1 Tax=Montipora capricornis TaxID=246305 RepID=UPI0035F1423C